MVLAHPVLIADPVPPACMGGGTLIYLSTGAKHTALRRAIGRAVTGFALKRGRGPPLLFPRGAAPAEWDSRAVRETVVYNLFARMCDEPPSEPLLKAMLSYFDTLPGCLLSEEYSAVQ